MSLRQPRSGRSAAGNEEPTTYTVAVKTSDIRGAGTDANVYITLIGKGNQQSKEMHLKDSMNHKNKFERGKGDVFFFPQTPSVGEIEQLRVRHDNSGPGPGWHLDTIEIHDSFNNICYTFICKNWLDKKEGDKKIDRYLVCTRKRQKHPKGGGGVPQGQMDPRLQRKVAALPPERPIEPKKEARFQMYPGRYGGYGGYQGHGGYGAQGVYGRGYGGYGYGRGGYPAAGGYPGYGYGYGGQPMMRHGGYVGQPMMGHGGYVGQPMMGHGGYVGQPMMGYGYGGMGMMMMKGKSWSWSWS